VIRRAGHPSVAHSPRDRSIRSGVLNKAEIFRLAREHLSAGRAAQAKAVFARALAKSPHDGDLCRNFGMTLASLGEWASALHYLEKSSRYFAGDLGLLCAIATMHSNLGNDGRALEIYGDVLRADPDHASALGCVGSTHAAHQRYDEALPRLRRAVEISPADPTLRQYLALCLVEMARAREGYDVLGQGLVLAPGNRTMVECRAFVSNYLDDITPAEVLGRHREFGACLTPPETGKAERTEERIENPDPDRRLRVGIVSPDLHEHPVACFAEAIFEHLDRADFEVIAYATRAVEDGTARRLRSLADAWREAAGLNDTEMAAGVRRDKIDILIDLAGLTRGHRLAVFSERAAPVQVTAIGYPTTTGVGAMDYRVVDGVTDPPTSDSLASERLARLPGCFLCYRPPGDGPAPERRHEDGERGGVTFGCFSTLRKVSPTTLETWAGVLRAAAGSKLLLKAPALATASVREDLSHRFEAQGVGAGRLEFLPWAAGHREHLATYARVDIALDTYPYTGTTTTCEALWMGVPVVTRMGGHHASRVSASLLRAVGRGEWVGEDAPSVARIAASLASDPTRLTAGRAALRETLVRSRLCDGRAYGWAIGEAYRSMWRERVARDGAPR
jgi:protein O-GlcNAc transferase